MVQQTLYERLGGVFAIAAVLDQFSDAVVKNPIVGRQSQNPQLREWHTLRGAPGMGGVQRVEFDCNSVLVGDVV